MNTCSAIIQQGPRKGTQCNKLTDSKYCSKHMRHQIIDLAKEKNVSYCDIARGCYVILDENQSKCKHCLHKARIRDRKRDDQKRQKDNVCLDCGNELTSKNRAKGKHDRELRRCITCNDKLQKYEAKRQPRERNYKAEAFKNKYVIWNHYVKGAHKRKIDFSISKDTFNSLIMQPCFYCNYSIVGEVNGIDRLDNNCGYIENNVVPCCQFCNFAKGSQHPQEFIDKLYAINKYKNKLDPIDTTFIDKWRSLYLSKTIPNFNNYKKSANSRNLEFTISEEEFNEMIRLPCYLCGLLSSDENTNGIDRFKNNIGYVIDNCRPCCGHCNILKRDLTYDKIIEIASKVANNYDHLTQFINSKNIITRDSKIPFRIKVENNIISESQQREYKPINETIIMKDEIDKDILELLKKENIEQKLEDKHITLKQWKTKQIYEAIISNTESTYKEYCEKHNNISKISDWDIKWDQFILSVKNTCSFEDAKQNINAFIEDLRRIRHNELCYNKNAKIVDRENRQQWPSSTVARAFLDNKIDSFKQYCENHINVLPSDENWKKRWNNFLQKLEIAKENNEELKNICSNFMAAQRKYKYRNQK